jgi:glutamate-1-semialdehyde 2,1-aminomutase
VALACIDELYFFYYTHYVKKIQSNFVLCGGFMRPDFLRASSRASQFFLRAANVMPGGNSRHTLFEAPHPPYAVRGEGCYLFDADGTKYLDFVNNYTSLIHGHAHPATVTALTGAIASGWAFSMPTEHEVQLAELLCERIPSVERVRFTNSGTEAVMMAVKAARAFTGRSRIAKFEGCYHGSYDQVEISTFVPPSAWTDVPTPFPVSRGTPPEMLEQTLVLRYNDLEGATRILEQHGSTVAALLVDPAPARIGAIEGRPDFLAGLRELTSRLGIVLIFDEIISYRVASGGMQSIMGVLPDLTCVGKFIGGTIPCSAFGGRAEIMDVFNPTKATAYHGGTFNANPLAMIAGRVTLEHLTPAVYARLDFLGERLRTGLRAVLQDHGLAGQVLGRASMFYLHLHNQALTDYRSSVESAEISDLKNRIRLSMAARGVLITPMIAGSLSTPMNEAQIDTFVDVFDAALQENLKLEVSV